MLQLIMIGFLTVTKMLSTFYILPSEVAFLFADHIHYGVHVFRLTCSFPATHTQVGFLTELEGEEENSFDCEIRL